MTSQALQVKWPGDHFSVTLTTQKPDIPGCTTVPQIPLQSVLSHLPEPQICSGPGKLATSLPSCRLQLPLLQQGLDPSLRERVTLQVCHSLDILPQP